MKETCHHDKPKIRSDQGPGTEFFTGLLAQEMSFALESSLRLIAVRDQMAAALDQLRLQIAVCIDVLGASSEQSAQIAQTYRDIEAPIDVIDEFLALERKKR